MLTSDSITAAMLSGGGTGRQCQEARHHSRILHYGNSRPRHQPQVVMYIYMEFSESTAITQKSTLRRPTTRLSQASPLDIVPDAAGDRDVTPWQSIGPSGGGRARVGNAARDGDFGGSRSQRRPKKTYSAADIGLLRMPQSCG
ncbi:hypothetical protein VTK56DRAFT_9023 [Thermocarpiscus australiensis]